MQLIIEDNFRVFLMGENESLNVISEKREFPYNAGNTCKLSRTERICHALGGILKLVYRFLINNDFLKHKQANINVKSRRFGVIVTPFSRQSE